MNRSKLVVCLIIFTLTACNETSQEAQRNLEALKTKALTLDSLISIESGKLKKLDSVIADEFVKAGRLDSVITHESKRIDSLIRKIYKKVEEKAK